VTGVSIKTNRRQGAQVSTCLDKDKSTTRGTSKHLSTHLSTHMPRKCQLFTNRSSDSTTAVLDTLWNHIEEIAAGVYLQAEDTNTCGSRTSSIEGSTLHPSSPQERLVQTLSGVFDLKSSEAPSAPSSPLGAPQHYQSHFTDVFVLPERRSSCQSTLSSKSTKNFHRDWP